MGLNLLMPALRHVIERDLTKARAMQFRVLLRACRRHQNFKPQIENSRVNR